LYKDLVKTLGASWYKGSTIYWLVVWQLAEC